MNDFARIFDLPVDSPEHQTLAQEAWLVGGVLTVPYFLGRLLNENLFKVDRPLVAQKLSKFFIDRGWKRVSLIAFNYSSWDTLGRFLEHLAMPRKATSEARRHFRAIEAFLENPDRSNAQIAAALNTTEKQINRIVTLTWLRRLLTESATASFEQ